MKCFILTFSIAFLFAQAVFAQTLLSGTVIDSETGSPLPLATVRITGTTLGAATNLTGNFSLLVPVAHQHDSLQINFLGYQSQILAVASLGSEPLSIGLQPALRELAEVVVRPLQPEAYIREAMAKNQANYGQTFQADAYFRQLISDKEKPVQFVEGYFQTYFPLFLDTTAIQQRLLLFSESDDVVELEFGQRRQAKKLRKAEKKAEKSGEAFNEEAVQEASSMVQMGMFSPAELIEADPVRCKEGFLNPETLDQYTYEFADNTVFQEREVVVIHFQSKGKVAQESSSLKARMKGTLYFDKSSDALVGVNYDSKMPIPAVLKPILYLAGYSIGNPEIRKQVRYQTYGNQWFPQTIRFDLSMKLTRRHLFSHNEVSDLSGNILVNFQSVATESTTPIPHEYRFDSDKEAKGQVRPREGFGWPQVNRIALEKSSR